MGNGIQADDVEALRQRLTEDFPYWAERLAHIVTKTGELVPFNPKPGQLELERLLCEQRAAGNPQRALALKARQVGISTYSQSKLTHGSTLRARYDSLTVAHDRETGAKLYRMAETIYRNLPEDPFLKPKLGAYRRKRELHYEGDAILTQGMPFPDSRYLVDTAGEFEAGRGGTYRALHGSEVAFWPQILQKLTALNAAIPDDPESLVILESTANGFNEWKDLWDDAEAGRSDFIAFFWPWWKEEEYQRPFASETEKEAFIMGDPTNPYAEEESDLVKHFGLTLEQLNWRRYVIANKCGGDVRIFHQEYPASPEQAFIATGQKVFDPYRVAQLVKRVEETDPKVPTLANPGPQIGDLKPGSMRQQFNRKGQPIEIPETALWTPRPPGLPNPTAPFRLWLPKDENPAGDYVIGVDVSGGNTETTRDPDYHAIQVIDHETLEQVAVYRSRIEPEQLAEVVLLTALYFNNAWVGIERTGGWGMPILRILWLDYRYPHVFRQKQMGKTAERSDQRLGWDTNQKTKPELVSGMAGLLQNEVDGIKCRMTADEVRTYTRTEKGTTEAEPGRYDDLLMAYMIAQQLARELPRKSAIAASPAGKSFRAGGLRAYDPRY